MMRKGCNPAPCRLKDTALERLHRGVLRDLERLSQKEENIRLLEEQIALTKQLEEERDKMLMEKGSQQS
ncbi:protein PET117 homolog, mitochondrial [Apteryx rowi]|uniref:protein PET117 homolog, mitochondrial n=1 Tax=Apteryx rowi TaxID=308060 RepID=UPI000E1E1B8C|nr:protein PET117 homolog, mitochondrial [Apteryx rowi]